MSFAQPLAWLWLALAVPIVIFYILKIRLRRVPVSTLMFWRKIYDEKQPRSLWQKLRHILSLLLQLLFLALLTFALVDPHFAWESLQSRRIVIVLDNSGECAARMSSHPDSTRPSARRRRSSTVPGSTTRWLWFPFPLAPRSFVD